MAGSAPGVDPTKTPLVPAPAGQQSNFVNPVSHVNEYYIIAGICTALMTFLVFVRLYIRFLVTRTPWWDDSHKCTTQLSQFAYTGVIIKEGSLGLGRHAWEVTLANFAEFDKYARPLTAPAIYFTKLTLLLLYLRLFLLNRPVKIGIWGGIVFCTIYYTAAFFLNLFLKDLHALSKLAYSVGVVGVVSDVYIITLPLLAIAQLRLSRAKKWRVAAVFLTGLLSVVMSFLGCIYRFQVNIVDITYSLLPIYIVNTLEVDIGIICTCLPLLGALFKENTKESRRPTSSRSIHIRLSPSRSRFPHSVDKKHQNHSSDNIELLPQTSASGAVPETNIVSPPSSPPNAIWRKTTIEQKWGESCC
ncbi:putative plasma membrane protein Pth11-like [Aspergillus novofumigatus IBT 16806]|uniref:Putative plasma membrane protein Pth11-like protein n=1 Tax=Aspergillus novofumigatus (strain IBT 16806) TaxID=1392255 RepID=A0A2I1BWN5_ASPN1|nr:putative plasma membrane protein Pth11-like protein [Aspergillus novofumigatus IBT 16806]PKX89794.1 putative plasma membrane protein Pth11-like protein [Aspergillus novofumigatus IBT 16806]